MIGLRPKPVVSDWYCGGCAESDWWGCQDGLRQSYQHLETVQCCCFMWYLHHLVNNCETIALLYCMKGKMPSALLHEFFYILHTSFIPVTDQLSHTTFCLNKKAQLSLTNPRDAKACQKLLQFDVLTTLSLTILAYRHAFSCCCVRNLRNPEKFTEISNLWSSRSSKVIDLGANRKPICDLLLVINSNFSRICYRFRDIHG